MYKLYDHQKKLKHRTYRAIQQGHKSILKVLATGGGKTIEFSDIANDAAKRNQSTWILTHREEIRLQTVEKLYAFGLQPGQIASGRPLTKNRVQVASIQTLTNMIEDMKRFKIKPDWIITDECHHATAPTWERILAAFPDAIKLGYTATPTRQDEVGLGEIYTKMIEGKQSAWLVENGFLTHPVVFSSDAALEFRKQRFKIVNNEFDLKAQTAILGQRKIVQDTVDCYARYFGGAPCIIFCASSQDMKVVDEAMKYSGWKGGIVKSGMDPELRRDYIGGLGTGKYNYLCSYEVIGEGVDIPVLAGVILRRLTKGVANYLQWIGRALRKYPGKKYGIIIDQAGNYYLHGHPLEHRNWTLDGKPIRRREDEIKSIECPNPLCRAFITDNPVKCPYCGIDLMNRKKTKKRNKELRIVDAELLQVHMPVYQESRKQPQAEMQDELLKEITANTLEKVEKDNNTVENRFDFLMNTMKKSQINKTWGEYGK